MSIIRRRVLTTTSNSATTVVLHVWQSLRHFRQSIEQSPKWFAPGFGPNHPQKQRLWAASWFWKKSQIDSEAGYQDEIYDMYNYTWYFSNDVWCGMKNMTEAPSSIWKYLHGFIHPFRPPRSAHLMTLSTSRHSQEWEPTMVGRNHQRCI